jgi:SAM-dependent methyltransferase
MLVLRNALPAGRFSPLADGPTPRSMKREALAKQWDRLASAIGAQLRGRGWSSCAVRSSTQLRRARRPIADMSEQRTTALTSSPRSSEVVRACAEAIRPDASVERWYRKFSTVQAERLAVDLDIVDRFVDGGSAILEVGAAPFILTLALAREGFEVTAVDLDPSRFERAISEHGLQVAKCDIETEALPFPDASFDTVILNEVFEHLRINPVFTLREVRRVLRGGGTLLLSTPNLRSLNGLWNLLVHSRTYALADNVYDEYSKLERLGHMGHVREYAPGDVKTLLTKIGFDVETLVFRGRQRNPIAEATCRVLPDLRRFVSFVARAT